MGSKQKKKLDKQKKKDAFAKKHAHKNSDDYLKKGSKKKPTSQVQTVVEKPFARPMTHVTRSSKSDEPVLEFFDAENNLILFQEGISGNDVAKKLGMMERSFMHWGSDDRYEFNNFWKHNRQNLVPTGAIVKLDPLLEPRPAEREHGDFYVFNRGQKFKFLVRGEPEGYAIVRGHTPFRKYDATVVESVSLDNLPQTFEGVNVRARTNGYLLNAISDLSFALRVSMESPEDFKPHVPLTHDEIMGYKMVRKRPEPRISDARYKVVTFDLGVPDELLARVNYLTGCKDLVDKLDLTDVEEALRPISIEAVRQKQQQSYDFLKSKGVTDDRIKGYVPSVSEK